MAGRVKARIARRAASCGRPAEGLGSRLNLAGRRLDPFLAGRYRTVTPSQPVSTQGSDPLPMSRDEILSSITDIMRDVFDVDDLNVALDTTADDVEDWDSLSHIRLIVAVERKFGIKFKNSEIESLKNVGELVNLVSTKAG
jgi:acyl carrier protein